MVAMGLGGGGEAVFFLGWGGGGWVMMRESFFFLSSSTTWPPPQFNSKEKRETTTCGSLFSPSLLLSLSPFIPILAPMRPTVAAPFDHAKGRGAHGGKAHGFRRRSDDDSTPPERLAASRFFLLPAVVAALPWLLLLLQQFRLSFQFVLELLSDPASSGGEHRAGGRRGKKEAS